jgi:tRNA (guanine37-N1)-methyltransferase
MRIDILTILPKLFEGPFSDSILKRAQDKGHLEICIHNIRDFSTDKHKNVDDYQYGGGAGMVMRIEPIAACIDKLKSERQYDEIIYMTPDGNLLDQQTANQLSIKGNLMILCGHYKGVDERIRQHYITKELSIGSYVLSGGELAAAVLVDSDSFQDQLLSPPVYTRPPIFNGWAVPDILLSGNPHEIEQWREYQALIRTKERRPDLLD